MGFLKQKLFSIEDLSTEDEAFILKILKTNIDAANNCGVVVLSYLEKSMRQNIEVAYQHFSQGAISFEDARWIHTCLCDTRKAIKEDRGNTSEKESVLCSLDSAISGMGTMYKKIQAQRH